MVICDCSIEGSGGRLQFASYNLYRLDGDEMDRGRRGEDDVWRDGEGRALIANSLHTKHVLKNRSHGAGTATATSNATPRSKT